MEEQRTAPLERKEASGKAFVPQAGAILTRDPFYTSTGKIHGENLHRAAKLFT